VAVRDGNIVGWGEHFRREACEVVAEESEDSPGLYRALLCRVESAAREAGIEHMYASATYHQVRWREALTTSGYAVADRYVFQVAIIDLENLLARLKPLFDRELAISKFDTWPGRLRIEMEDKVAEIQLGGGRQGRQISISGGYPAIVRMLCGRVSAWQGFLRGELKLSGDFNLDDRELLNVYLGQRPWLHPKRGRW